MPQVVVGLTPAQGRRFIPGYAEPGWTKFTATPNPETTGTRIVYVAASGNDQWCGYKPDTSAASCPGYANHPPGTQHGPRKTISSGLNLIRNGYPDWLLLNKGDTFTQTGPFWLSKNGPNAAEKFLITSYGDQTKARPRIVFPSNDDGFLLGSRTAIVDVQVEANPPTWTGKTGIGSDNTSDVLIEGCCVKGWTQGISTNGCQNFTVRRNVILDTHVTGIIVEHAYNALIEENIIYKVGESDPSPSEHGIYITAMQGTGYIIRRNLLSDIRYNGIDARQDFGVVEENVLVRCKANIDVGAGNPWCLNPDLTVQVTRNSILQGCNPWDLSEGPYGIRLAQGVDNAITDNIIANSEASTGYFALRHHTYTETGIPQCIGTIMHSNNASFLRNLVWNWGGDQFLLSFDGGTVSNLTIAANEFQDLNNARIAQFNSAGVNSQIKSYANVCWSTLSSGNWFQIAGVNKTLAQYKTDVGDPPVGQTGSLALQRSYPQPGLATTGDYAAKLGIPSPSHTTFMAEAIKMRKGNWQLAYTTDYINKYIRTTCFGK